jgi:hypothetical protein
MILGSDRLIFFTQTVEKLPAPHERAAQAALIV